MKKIKSLIKTRISEHTQEAEFLEEKLKQLQKEIIKCKNDLQSNQKDAILKSASYMKMAQKESNHRFAIRVLEELLENCDD